MIKKVQLFFRLPLSRKIFLIRRVFWRLKSITIYRLVFREISSSSVLMSPTFVTPEFISIGSKVKIWHDARIEGVDEYAGKFFSPEIVIEDGVEIHQRVNISATHRLIIGSNTTISFDVMVTDNDHKYDDINTHVGEQELFCRETRIGKNCFLGAGAKILAGTILGDNCIIGANTVVRGEFPKGCVIAGSPAVIIKKYDYSSHLWIKSK